MGARRGWLAAFWNLTIPALQWRPQATDSTLAGIVRLTQLTDQSKCCILESILNELGEPVSQQNDPGTPRRTLNHTI